MGFWRPEISSPELRFRETYWRASPPPPPPLTRVCPFSSRSTTCIIGSPYPENIHLRTLDTNTLYSIPWDNSHFPPRLSLMITFWHCIINVCPWKKIPFKVNPWHETFGPCLLVAWIRVSYYISYGENIQRTSYVVSCIKFSVDSTYRYCSSVRFVNMVSGRSSSLLKDSDLEISNSSR